MVACGSPPLSEGQQKTLDFEMETKSLGIGARSKKMDDFCTDIRKPFIILFSIAQNRDKSAALECTMTKVDIAQCMYDKFGDLTMTQAADYVEVALDTIKSTLASGEDVLISGFGKFSVRDKRERVGRNPVTGDKLILPARRVVTFKPAAILKEQVNSGSNTP